MGETYCWILLDFNFYCFRLWCIMSTALKSCGMLQESAKHYQVLENFQIGILRTVGCVFKRMSHSKTHESYERFKQFV